AQACKVPAAWLRQTAKALGSDGWPSERRPSRWAITELMHRSKHQAGPSVRSVSGACLSSALLTNSTESIAAPSWVRNCSIASFIGGGRSPHQSITPLIAASTVRSPPLHSRHSAVASSLQQISRKARAIPLPIPSDDPIPVIFVATGGGQANYSAGSTASTPFFFNMTTTNFAGFVVLALRPTVCTSLGPS